VYWAGRPILPLRGYSLSTVATLAIAVLTLDEKEARALIERRALIMDLLGGGRRRTRFHFRQLIWPG